MNNQSDEERIFQWLSHMKLADTSVLDAVIKKYDEGSGIMWTTKGSANDLLWAEMERLGWTKRVPHAFTSTDEKLLESLTAFSITENGKEPIKRLLEEFHNKQKSGIM